MYKKLLCCLVLVLLLPASIFAATTGKIRGTVVDRETGEALPAANVSIVGTSIGAAADLNGEYIILNVPVGVYTLKATFVGYRDVEISNVAVHAGLTMEVNFQVPTEAIEGETVTIIAERPLVDKNVTHEIHSLRAEDMENLPMRGTGDALSILPGVVDDAGIHVRGGRRSEMAYYVDGINVTMPSDGANGLTVIPNAIEAITYHAGGFGAEYGTRMSGQTFTTMKTGTANYSFGGEFISDDFWAFEADNGSKQILGVNKAYSYGYDDYILWGSGPVPFLSNVKFFVTGQRYWRHPGNTRFEGFTIPAEDSVIATGSWVTSGKDAGTTIKDTLGLTMDVPPGRYPGGNEAGWTLNGNVIWDKKPFRVKLGGTFNIQRDQGGTTEPRNFLVTPVRARLNKRGDYSGYLALTHTVDPTIFYTLNLSYFVKHHEFGDPNLGWDRADWPSWGDPIVNPALIDTSTIRSFKGPGDFYITHPGTPMRDYEKNHTTMMGTKLDFTKQFGSAHEVKLGGEMNYYTIRTYRVRAREYLRRMATADAVEGTPNFMTDWDFYRGLFTTFTGYDIHGEKEVNSDEYYTSNVAGQEVKVNAHNKPGHPLFAGAYLQDRIELKDLIVNAGLRLDYIDNGVPGYKDLQRLTMGTAQVIDETNFTESKKFAYVSPRLGFSFPVTDQTIFHAQYGKYVQPTRTDMRGTGISSYGYMLTTQYIYGGGYAAQISNPNLKPERQTTYEFGFKKSFANISSLDITSFYKDTRDYTTMRVVFPEVNDYRAPYFNMNEDFGTIKGVSFTFNLRRTHNIQVMANYTYSDAKGTGSEPRSHFDIAWTESTPIFPVVIGRLDYDQRHKGWIDLDLRFPEGEGPELFGMKPLSRLGLNTSFNFHSGSPFTRVDATYGSEAVFGIQHPEPLEAYNVSSLPWFYQLDLKLDKSFKIGPLDLNAYLWVINALDTKSVTNMWRATGRPDDDGWLETDQGRKWAETHGEDGVKWFKTIMTDTGTYGWQTPRIIRGGLKFNL